MFKRLFFKTPPDPELESLETARQETSTRAELSRMEGEVVRQRLAAAARGQLLGEELLRRQ